MRERFSFWSSRLRRVKPLAWVNAVVLFTAISGFLLIAHEVADGEHLALDKAIMHSVQTVGSNRPDGTVWLAELARDVTALGSMIVLSALTMLVTGFLALSRRFGAALFLIIAAAGGQILNTALKLVYGRPRPETALRWLEIDSLSFPSGHATSSAVIYLTLAVLLARLTDNKERKAYLIGSALLLSFFVGLSRVYLGVHYPTDVVAGWALGIAWAQLCWFAARAIGRRRLATTTAR
jgi:undecaprenyl-diphosphatase